MHDCPILTHIHSRIHQCKCMHTHYILTLKKDGKKVCMLCVSSYTGQDDVPSHICQHPEFIYSVRLAFVDLVTWSESGRCRTLSTLESQDQDVMRDTGLWPNTHSHAHNHLNNMTSSFYFQMLNFPIIPLLWLLSPSAVLFNPPPFLLFFHWWILFLNTEILPKATHENASYAPWMTALEITLIKDISVLLSYNLPCTILT